MKFRNMSAFVILQSPVSFDIINMDIEILLIAREI